MQIMPYDISFTFLYIDFQLFISRLLDMQIHHGGYICPPTQELLLFKWLITTYRKRCKNEPVDTKDSINGICQSL